MGGRRRLGQLGRPQPRPALAALGPPGSQPGYPPPTSRSHTLLTTSPAPTPLQPPASPCTFWKGPSLRASHALPSQCFSLGLPHGWVPAQPQRITLGTTSLLSRPHSGQVFLHHRAAHSRHQPMSSRGHKRDVCGVAGSREAAGRASSPGG